MKVGRISRVPRIDCSRCARYSGLLLLCEQRRRQHAAGRLREDVLRRSRARGHTVKRGFRGKGINIRDVVGVSGQVDQFAINPAPPCRRRRILELNPRDVAPDDIIRLPCTDRAKLRRVGAWLGANIGEFLRLQKRDALGVGVRVGVGRRVLLAAGCPTGERLICAGVAVGNL